MGEINNNNNNNNTRDNVYGAVNPVSVCSDCQACEVRSWPMVGLLLLIVACQWRIRVSRTVSRCIAVIRSIMMVSQLVLLSLVTSLVLTRLDYDSIALTGISSLPGASWIDYSQCWMQQQDLYAMVVSTTVFHHCSATFTGCVSQNALNFVLLFLRSTAATGQRLHTWPETYSGQLKTTLVSFYGLWSASSHKLIVRRSRLITAGDRVGLLLDDVISAPSLTVLKMFKTFCCKVWCKFLQILRNLSLKLCLQHFIIMQMQPNFAAREFRWSRRSGLLALPDFRFNLFSF